MPVPDGFVALLLQQSSISTVVGDRIQPVPAPEDLSQYPLITYQSPSDTPLDQNCDGPSGVTESRIVFDCLAKRYLDARNLARAVKSALNGFTGNLPDFTHIEDVETGMVDRFEDGSRIYCTSVHALVRYRD
jgi:hypothetical protein